MSKTSILVPSLVGMLLLVACGSSSSKPRGTGGTVGGGGQGGGNGGGSGSAFTPIEPCLSESDYTTTTTITFPNADSSYSPKCAQVSVGAALKFMATEGTFQIHPLTASSLRGNPADSPLTNQDNGNTFVDITPGVPGFYGFYCRRHGDDEGSGEAGVLWVQ